MKAQNEYFLAQWLDGRLSDDELRKRVTNQEFEEYVRLRDALSVSQLAAPDIESNFRRTKEKMSRGFRPKIRRIIPRYAVVSALAACIVIGIAVFQIFTFGPEFRSNAGHRISIALPEGSVVQMNSGSTLRHTEMFTYNRKIKLDGEAFFDVSKGGPFIVQTHHGEVEVLGTSFNVIARDGYFDVTCYEGSVRVSTQTKVVVLEKGQAFRQGLSGDESWTTPFTQPGWIAGESRFEHAPLELVLLQLGSEYGYNVKLPDPFKQSRFTGTFTRANLTTALKTVLLPMGLQYRIEDKTIVVHP